VRRKSNFSLAILMIFRMNWHHGVKVAGWEKASYKLNGVCDSDGYHSHHNYSARHYTPSMGYLANTKWHN
jgi:hypothetical protein